MNKDLATILEPHGFTPEYRGERTYWHSEKGLFYLHPRSGDFCFIMGRNGYWPKKNDYVIDWIEEYAQYLEKPPGRLESALRLVKGVAKGIRESINTLEGAVLIAIPFAGASICAAMTIYAVCETIQVGLHTQLMAAGGALATATAGLAYLGKEMVHNNFPELHPNIRANVEQAVNKEKSNFEYIESYSAQGSDSFKLLNMLCKNKDI